MDHQFTKKIGDFLQKGTPTDEEIREAAKWLLQCDPLRSRGIYNSALLRPQSMLPWVRNDLKKFYNIRMRGFERSQVDAFNKEAVKAVKESLSSIPEGVDLEASPQIPVLEIRGRRKDHDQLPEDIKALWDKNAERWKKIRQLHNQLLLMVGKPGYQACDGNELCHVLRETDGAMRDDYHRYDTYVITKQEEKPSDNADAVDVFTSNVKTIQNARTAITRGLARETQDETSLAKIQNAVNTLLALKQDLRPGTIKKLKDLGIEVNAHPSNG